MTLIAGSMKVGPYITLGVVASMLSGFFVSDDARVRRPCTVRPLGNPGGPSAVIASSWRGMRSTGAVLVPETSRLRYGVVDCCLPACPPAHRPKSDVTCPLLAPWPMARWR